MANLPKYRQIADELRRQIADGTLGPGDQLPTEAQLQEVHDIARGTAREAIDELVAAGLVERRPGRSGGVFVRKQVRIDAYEWRDDEPPTTSSEADLFFRTVREQGGEPSQDYSTHIRPMPAAYAEILQVPTGSPAVLRRCVRRVDGVPHSIQETWYPEWICDVVPELRSPSDIAQGTTRLLADCGYVQVAAAGATTARMPSLEEAALLGLTGNAGVPVIINELVGYTGDRPIRVSVATFAADKVRLITLHGDLQVMQGRPR